MKARVPALNVAPSGSPLAAYVMACASGSVACTLNASARPSDVFWSPTGSNTGVWFSDVAGSRGIQKVVVCFSAVGVLGLGVRSVVAVAPL